VPGGCSLNKLGENGRPKRKYAAAVLLICETRPVHEVVAKLTPVEFERVVDIVHRSQDHFPTGTLAALKSRSPIPAHRQQSASVSTDRENRQRLVGKTPDMASERPAHVLKAVHLLSTSLGERKSLRRILCFQIRHSFGCLKYKLLTEA
jgi:hypothetical protein